VDPIGNAAATSDGRVHADPVRALRWWLALYLASAACVAVQRTAFATENNFLIFRAAFTHVSAGQDLYAAYPSLHADFFKYSPTFALLFAPFALLPLVPGYLLWAVVCAMAVFAGIVRALPPRQAIVALALAWLPVVGDLQRAQSNALCAGLMILAWGGFERGHTWRPAMAIATATLVKLFPVVMLTVAVFRPRRIRSGVIFAAILLVFAALPLLVTPPATLAMQYRSWHAILRRDAAPVAQLGTGGGAVYAGIMGQLRLWWGVHWPNWPVQLAGALVLFAPLVVRRSEFGSLQFRCLVLASILVFCVLFNHKAESPSFSIAMIGMAIWFAVSERAWWRTALMAASFVVVNLMSTDLMPRAWYHGWYVPHLVKTIPLIPVWVVMQLELAGLIPNGLASHPAERDHLRAVPAEPDAPQPTQ
jgi:hypothetical protein